MRDLIPITQATIYLAFCVGMTASPATEAAGATAATVCMVNADASDNTPSGRSWASAYRHIEDALDDSGCQEVWVAAGVYTPGATIDDYFRVHPGQSLYGGFAGGETARNQRSLDPDLTILSGDVAGDDVNTDGNFVAETSADIQGANSLHIVRMDGTIFAPLGGDTIVDGFTVTAGSATASSFPDSAGGGLLCMGTGSGNECSPSLSHLVFSGNQAVFGGAMTLAGSEDGTSVAVLEAVRFVGNSASENGGALFNHGSGDGIVGGNSSPILHNVSFSGNSARFGGAICNNGYGGESSPVIGRASFVDNYASESGGAIFNNGSENGSSNPVIYNATFAGNSADWGGGMYNDGRHNGSSSPSLYNVTLYGNHGARGGAIASDADHNGFSEPVLSNVIIWDNTVTHSGAALQNDDGAMPTIDHSVVQGSGGSGFGWDDSLGVDGWDNTDDDPLLGTLARHGGFTATMVPSPSGSAVGEGSYQTCTDSATVNGVDQRGWGRPYGWSCDIGAVEWRNDVLFSDGFDG